MLFCKPKSFFTGVWKIPLHTAFPPVNPWFTGVFPYFSVEKPVDNVDNSPCQNSVIFHNFCVMSTDIPSTPLRMPIDPPRHCKPVRTLAWQSFGTLLTLRVIARSVATWQSPGTIRFIQDVQVSHCLPGDSHGRQSRPRNDTVAQSGQSPLLQKHTSLRGERADRCRWQREGGKRVAAVGVQCRRTAAKAHTGYRNRNRQHPWQSFGTLLTLRVIARSVATWQSPGTIRFTQDIQVSHCLPGDSHGRQSRPRNDTVVQSGQSPLLQKHTSLRGERADRCRWQREASEWPRSACNAGAPPPRRTPGTATGIASTRGNLLEHY